MYHKEPDVRFVESKITGPQDIISAAEGLRNSRFCLNAAGVTPSSARLFDAITSHCVAVVTPSLPPSLSLPTQQAAEGLRSSRFCLNAAGDTPSSARLFDAIASHCVPAAEGLRNSRFCLNAAGDTPSSARLFDAITSHCVPVVISNKIELPFETSIDYSDFTLFVSHEDALRQGYLLRLLRTFPKERWLRMWQNLQQVKHHFEFQYPSQPGDAVSMVWREIRKKLPRVRLAIHRGKRLVVRDWTNV
ncbi:unnamed protein product [Closterium sp. Naga37s-1]|nr:unnamed protein product [Closterium sp. Naga37s-1]